MLTPLHWGPDTLANGSEVSEQERTKPGNRDGDPGPVITPDNHGFWFAGTASGALGRRERALLFPARRSERAPGVLLLVLAFHAAGLARRTRKLVNEDLDLNGLPGTVWQKEGFD